MTKKRRLRLPTVAELVPRPDPNKDPDAYWEDAVLRGVIEGLRRRRKRMREEARTKRLLKPVLKRPVGE